MLHMITLNDAWMHNVVLNVAFALAPLYITRWFFVQFVTYCSPPPPPHALATAKHAINAIWKITKLSELFSFFYHTNFTSYTNFSCHFTWFGVFEFFWEVDLFALLMSLNYDCYMTMDLLYIRERKLPACRPYNYPLAIRLLLQPSHPSNQACFLLLQFCFFSFGLRWRVKEGALIREIHFNYSKTQGSCGPDVIATIINNFSQTVANVISRRKHLRSCFGQRLMNYFFLPPKWCRPISHGMLRQRPIKTSQFKFGDLSKRRWKLKVKW